MENLFKKLIIYFIPCQENNYKSRFLESEILYYYILFLLVLKLIAISFFLYFPKTIFFADLTKITLIELTNQERKLMGLAPLKENPALNQAAYLKAQDMLNADYFSHWSPSGVSPWYWFKKVGYNYQMAGENLAIGFLDSEEVVTAWKNSPSHRANLLNPKFQEIGIAVLSGEFQGGKATVVVQLFGSPQQTKTIQETPKTTTTQISSPIITESPSSILPSPTITPSGTSIQTEIVQEKPKETTTGVIAGTQHQLKIPPEEFGKPSFKFEFLKFMTIDYPDILQKIIYYSLWIIILAFLLNVFIRFQNQDPKLILKTITFILLLILFNISDKEAIIQIIPHNLLI